MNDKPVKKGGVELPECATQFIGQVVRKMRYTRRARREVQAELTAHFEDELRDCPDAAAKEQQAQRLIDEFGDARLLAALCRRAKKRCRPLWVRAFARTMQTIGVFLLVFIPYTIWFVRGRAQPTVDYLPQVNALNWSLGRAEDNAWPYYDKAMRLLVEPNEAIQNASWFGSSKPPGEPLTPQERARLEGWMAVNSPAWSQFELGAAKGYCHRTYRRLPGRPLLMSSMEDPPLASLRGLARIGLWKSRLAIEQGHIDEGLGHCLTLVRGAAHLETNGFMIQELVAYAVGAQGCWEIRGILNSKDLSVSQLSELQGQVIRARRQGYPPLSLEGERLATLDGIGSEFTAGGIGGGHHVVGPYAKFAYAAMEVPDTPENRNFGRIMMPFDVGASMIHAGRTRTIAKVNQLYDRMSDTVRRSPYEWHLRGMHQASEGVGRFEKLRYGMVYLLLPAERRASELRFQSKADHEALVTILAVERYRLETGSYPRDLKTLVDARYLGELPVDPFSDQPLVYKRVGDNFLLYSVGRDFNDDGGEPGRDSQGKAKIWAETGDAVFWPVNP